MVEASFWDKNKVPNITGIRKNGSRIDLILNEYEWNELNLGDNFIEGDILSIFENGKIVIHRPIYNSRLEIYDEKVLIDIHGEKEIEKMKKKLISICIENTDDDICEKINKFLNKMEGENN